MDAGHWILDVRDTRVLRVCEAKSVGGTNPNVGGTGCWMLDTRCSMLDVRDTRVLRVCEAKSVGGTNPDVGGTRCWILVNWHGTYELKYL